MMDEMGTPGEGTWLQEGDLLQLVGREHSPGGG